MSSTWKSENWIAASWDRLHRGRHVLLGIDQWIFRERSEFQDVAIAHVPDYGRGLFLDSLVEFLAADEFVYHEAFALTPLLFHPAPRRVLIAGGGDGLALREVLRDPRVEEVVLVEIDGVVIDACKAHLSALHCGSFDDPRADIKVGDALPYLESPPSQFDVILVDLLDGYDPAARALYAKVVPLTKGALRPGGIVSAFGEVAFPHLPLWPVRRQLMSQYTEVALHRATIETFSGAYGFLLASADVAFARTPTDTLVTRAAALAVPPRSLVPEAFPSCFRQPRYLMDALEAESPPELTGSYAWIEPLV